MGLKCGIVGLPNVGKSTLFNTLTSSQKAEASNYPFCTIDPHVGMVTVPDERLDKIGELIKPEKTIPAVMEFVDIAGLVKGASQGEGLGNKFLSHIRQTQALIHMVRCFQDSNITHIAETIEPLRDIEIINTELLLSDLESVEKNLAKKEKLAKTQKDKNLLFEVEVLKKVFDVLKEGISPKTLEFEEEEKEWVQNLGLLSFKPIVYVANTAEVEDKALTNQVKEYAEKEGSAFLSVSTLFESELSQMSKQEAQEFLQSVGLEEPGLNRLIRKAYNLLGLETYFTAGKKELKAWTFKTGIKAPQAAGIIHSDFERGFIKADVYKSQDLFELKSEAKIKEAGKLLIQGKDYTVQDGDVIFFKFNV